RPQAVHLDQNSRRNPRLPRPPLPTDLWRRTLASRLRAAGNTAKALAWYQHAAEAGDHTVVSDIADVLGEMGRVEKAIAWYQRAVEAQQSSLRSYKIASLLEKGAASKT
ncbi:hypothetical protein AB0D27_38865, partial [Streptomyces sp. NPDC048415]